MLAILIDAVGAYLATKITENIFLILLISIPVGVASAFIGNYMIWVVASDVFDEVEIVTRMVTGSVIHPTVTFVIALVIRRASRTRSARNNPPRSN